MWAAVSIGYNGKSGDVVAEAASFDATGRYGVQSPFSEGLAAKWRGSMWQVDATHNTLLTVANAGAKPAHARLILSYNAGAGEYQLPDKTLRPGEQMWVDVAELLRDQVPDADGRTLPPEAGLGSFRIRDEASPVAGHLYVGELLIDSGPMGHVHPMCAECCGFTSATISPDPIDILIGDNLGTTVWGDNQCNGMEDVTSSCYNWSSTNTSVATVDSSGNVTAVAGGTATIKCQVDLEGLKPASCPDKTLYPSAPMNGQTPGYVSVGTATADSVRCGTSSFFARRLTIPYQVLDSSSKQAPHRNSQYDGKGAALLDEWHLYDKRRLRPKTHCCDVDDGQYWELFGHHLQLLHHLHQRRQLHGRLAADVHCERILSWDC